LLQDHKVGLELFSHERVNSGTSHEVGYLDALDEGFGCLLL
jgi:hypothetical protein